MKVKPNRPTQDEINAEIAALEQMKPHVRQYTAFQDDNHAAIDAQVAVLKDGMDMDAIYEAYDPDGNPDSTQHELDAAISAHDWMTAQGTDGAPSSGWKEMVRA